MVLRPAGGLLAEDPLLASRVTKLGPPGGRHEAAGKVGPPGPRKAGLDINLWVVPFQELRLIKCIGGGSFGRVSELLAAIHVKVMPCWLCGNYSCLAFGAWFLNLFRWHASLIAHK